MKTERPKPIYASEMNTRAVRQGYEMGGYLKNRAEIEAWDKENSKPCLAQVAHTDANSSPTTQHSPTPEPGNSPILLDRLIRLEELVMAQSRKIDQLLDALAEDQDPDEMPATYMDGKPVL